MILGVVVQYVDGNQRIIHVSELPNDCKDSITSGEDVNSLTCCVYGNCSCSSLDHALANLTSNVLINITTDVTLSSLVRVSDLENVSIIGHNNPTVNRGSVGGIQFTFSHHLIIHDITWNGCGTENPENQTELGLKFSNSSNVMIKNCTFQNSIGQPVVLSELSEEVDIKDCNFINNYNYKGHGTLIHYTSQATRQCSRNYFMISNCNFTSNEGASLVYINNRYSECNSNNITFHCTNFYSNKGVSIYVVNQRLHFYGNSLFRSNIANDSAGIYISDHSTVIFDNNSDVTFVHNFAYRGAAVFLRNHSSITFDENSIVTFHNNNATNGTVYADTSSNVTFKGNCHVNFSSNSVTQLGAAIYSVSHSYIVFTGNSNVAFINNVVTNTDHKINESGGIICSGHNSYITFNENSATLFIENNARFYGGAIISYNHSHISFEGTSNTTFKDNDALYGGAIVLGYYSFIFFKENSISVFTDNTATWGGAISAFQHSNILFDGISTTKFNCNTANFQGGVIYSYHSHLLFEGNCNVTMNNNSASYGGGGALRMYCESQPCCKFGGNSTVTFSDNDAPYGGAMVAFNSKISFEGHARITMLQNKAENDGGSCYLSRHSIITLKDFASVTFENNSAFYTGGAIQLTTYSNVTFKDNSTTLFKRNRASDGGAIGTSMNSSITVQDYTRITFVTNNAVYGGAMFFDTTHTSLVFKDQDKDISFISNTARIAGDDMYFNSIISSGNCLNNRIIGIDSKTKRFISTPPNKLQFYTPATCIDDDNKTECDSYYLRHIMLGEEIKVPVCIFNYCDQPSDDQDLIQFLLNGGDNQNFIISGSNQTLISCNDTFQQISITGNNSLSKSSNYTINITLHDTRYSYLKQISVNLTVELTPCSPGFWQYSGSHICECYNTRDILYCSGSSSTIKRGYWFGSVTGKPTVTFCPINYCDFTCCEASNGYYHLSPVRDNQCRSHRSGTACGSCTDGYTLSFDSPECVNVDSCTAGQTVLVILLTVTYWIIMVTLVFAMMYYKVPIGYLYSITYYYSIVDILLSQNLQEFSGLFLIVSIISSFSKITPQFLGELCLTTGMSGIDQQFIHYIHPTAVILILVIISLSARSSRRISAFISRGIIHVICLLLLLSYTSIASTTLLLMRPLTFHEINAVYTYLSPDIEYFHGRHLPYGIVALISAVSITISLPILLILEPYLNHKINFAKIKPLLDQFQGCYKDKYRCFAGYYMICRLVIITIVIANSSNDLVANYLLIAVCGIIALIHLLIKPYNNEILNKYDGVILQLIILVTALLLLDDFDSPLVITLAFVLVFLALLIFILMILYLHKDDLKRIVNNCKFRYRSPISTDDANSNELVMTEYNLIIGNTMRHNATVCDT